MRDLVGQLGTGDQVLLVDRGVELVAHPRLLAGLGEACEQPLHALRIDLEARGLADLARAQGVVLAEDSDWVALVRCHRHALSWK